MPATWTTQTGYMIGPTVNGEHKNTNQKTTATTPSGLDAPAALAMFFVNPAITPRAPVGYIRKVSASGGATVTPTRGKRRPSAMSSTTDERTDSWP